MLDGNELKLLPNPPNLPENVEEVSEESPNETPEETPELTPIQEEEPEPEV